MKNNLLDLRFIIGTFFLLIGILLVVSSFTMPSTVEMGTSINRYSGIIFILFSVVMLILWKYQNTEEVVEEKQEAEEYQV